MYLAIAGNLICIKYTNYSTHKCGECFVFSPHPEKKNHLMFFLFVLEGSVGLTMANGRQLLTLGS